LARVFKDGVIVCMGKISYILKSKYLVSTEEKEQLKKLRYKDGKLFPEFNNKFKLGMVILAKNNSGEICSWGLIFERQLETTLFIFTKEKYRRMGFGSKIYSLAVDNFGQHIQVSRHNSIAKKFFDSVGA